MSSHGSQGSGGSGDEMESMTCTTVALDEIRKRADAAVSVGTTAMAVLVLPGSFNPVHSEHICSLELARIHLEQQGFAVVGGFLQPSSEDYVGSKVGEHWAMTFGHRVACCDLAAEANAAQSQAPQWIHTWRSAETYGFIVPSQVQAHLRKVLRRESLQAFMVCGSDLVERCGGWGRPAPGPTVVLKRPGVRLPCGIHESWQVATGETKPMSSTAVRDAMDREDWEQMVTEGCHSSVVIYMKAKHSEGNLFMDQASR